MLAILLADQNTQTLINFVLHLNGNYGNKETLYV